MNQHIRISIYFFCSAHFSPLPLPSLENLLSSPKASLSDAFINFCECFSQIINIGQWYSIRTVYPSMKFFSYPLSILGRGRACNDHIRALYCLHHSLNSFVVYIEQWWHIMWHITNNSKIFSTYSKLKNSWE